VQLFLYTERRFHLYQYAVIEAERPVRKDLFGQIRDAKLHFTPTFRPTKKQSYPRIVAPPGNMSKFGVMVMGPAGAGKVRRVTPTRLLFLS
jgi:hypothetical protein